jgi:predicted transcriptional regulator
MKVSEIIDILGARVFWGEHLLDTEVKSACGSDMMSDVLAFVKDQAVLVTGLCNPQVIRTAEMLDMACVVFVRNKVPDRQMIDMAAAKNIILLGSNYRMYSACGMLYSAGLGAGESKIFGAGESKL